VGPRRAEEVDVPTHGSGPDAGMAPPDRQGGGPLLRVRRDPEPSAPDGCRLCGGDEEEVGGYLDGQELLRGGSEVLGTEGVRDLPPGLHGFQLSRRNAN